MVTRKGDFFFFFFDHQIVSAVARASGSFIQPGVALKELEQHVCYSSGLS